MIDIIRLIPDWQNKTAEQIAAALATLVAVADTTAWTVGMLVGKLGPSKTIAVCNALDQSTNPIMRASFIALSTKDGLTLHQAERQGMIDLLGLSAELTSELKALGRPQVTLWESLGGSGDAPDSQAIDTELTRYTAEQEYEAIKTRADAAKEAAGVEYRAGRFDTITSAAEAAWSGE